MSGQSPKEVTQLLQAWSRGDETALDRLMPLVYDELRRLAHYYMTRENAGHILQTTALVNEAYLQLIDANTVNWQDRAHFFAISAKLMRRILVHFARSRNSQKRGGRLSHVSLDEAALLSSERDADLIELDEALTALAAIDPRKAKVVELRFFGGLSLEESGEVLGVSPDTVWRDWDLAKAWLYREMRRGET
ncbi:MAG: sigma-70 family RNA polymerase sigma factor [Acidobacteriia bacterium]|nr:sigma-70 family RNA polymerase sigma factor [Terriglobia bacterium]